MLIFKSQTFIFEIMITLTSSLVILGVPKRSTSRVGGASRLENGMSKYGSVVMSVNL